MVTEVKHGKYVMRIGDDVRLFGDFEPTKIKSFNINDRYSTVHFTNGRWSYLRSVGKTFFVIT